MKINEVAKLTGITVRTLHYYDEIGLLSPGSVTEAGYRIYDEKSLETLHQILFFRELLIKKRERMDNLISLINNRLEGKLNMSFKEFDITEIEAAKKEYAAEVKERWGHTEAYAESKEKTKNLNTEQWNMLGSEGNAILQEFGENRNLLPSSDEARKLVKKWQDYITANFYNCTDEILSGLGCMYTGDERFTKNIDRYGEGTAAFMSATIQNYCKK